MALLTAASVHATSPCTGDACLDDTSAELLAAVDVGYQRCAKSDPAHASEYLQARDSFLLKEDQPPGFIAKLQATPLYPAAVARINASLDAQSTAERAELCGFALRDARRR